MNWLFLNPTTIVGQTQVKSPTNHLQDGLFTVKKLEMRQIVSK